MKGICAILTLMLLGGASVARADWERTQFDSEQSSTAADIPALQRKYPKHFEFIDPVIVSYAYWIRVDTFIYTWVGETVCPAGDSRLKIELDSISYGAWLKDGSSHSGHEPKDLYLPEAPCK